MKKIKNMKIEEGFTFWTEALNLLIITKIFKNKPSYADCFGMGVLEGVTYEYDEQDELMGKDSHIVYGVIDCNKKIIKDQTSFYFDKHFAKSVCLQMNNHIGEKLKPYKVKKYYLIDFSLAKNNNI
jgi:hypothetical protein